MVKLQKAKPNDYAYIIDIENQLFHSMTSDEFSSYYIDNKLISIYMIIKDIDMVGYIVIWRDIDKSQIYSMFVNEANRRNNYAYQALLLLEKDLAQLGVKDWTLEVRKSNQAAINLYQKVGFKIETSRPNYYQNHEDAWLMIKKL